MSAHHRILFTISELVNHVGLYLTIVNSLIAQGYYIGYSRGEAIGSMIERAGVQKFYSQLNYRQVIMNMKTKLHSWLEDWSKVPTLGHSMGDIHTLQWNMVKTIPLFIAAVLLTMRYIRDLQDFLQ